MTPWEIRDALTLVDYKNWSFELLHDPFEGLKVRFVFAVPDAYDHDKLVDIGFESWLPPVPDEAYLQQWLWWRINRAESHETREFFRFNRAMPFDPHAEERAA